MHDRVADRLFYLGNGSKQESRMISLTDSGHAWRTCMCSVLDTKHDYNDSQVATFFAESADWARTEKIPIDDKVDHLAIYLASRDNGEPVIPEHVRRYCAHLKGMKLATEQQAAPKPAKTTAVQRPKLPQRKVPVKEPYHRRSAAR